MTTPNPAEPTTTTEPVVTEPQVPAAATPDPAPKKSLEDSLASLDDATRSFVLNELSSARNEAKNLRERVKAAEPKAAEFDRLAEASKSELERAQEAARAAEERATNTLERVAAAEVKAALTGIVDDPNALIEDLNIKRFITAQGEVDTEAIGALKAKYQAFAPKPGMKPNPAQGASAGAPLSPQQQAAQAAANGDFKAAAVIKAEQLLELRKQTS